MDAGGSSPSAGTGINREDLTFSAWSQEEWHHPWEVEIAGSIPAGQIGASESRKIETA